MPNKSIMATAILGTALFFLSDITPALTESGKETGSAQNNKKTEVGSQDSRLKNLSPEIKAKLEAERNMFFRQTSDLRAEIHKKKTEMKDELEKSQPDGQKLKTLRKEISGLEALLNKERYKFLKRLEQIHPEAGKGYFERGIMGND